MSLLDRIISGCFPVRFCRWLASFWPTSIAGRLAAAVSASWSTSVAGQLWDRLLDAESHVPGSLYDRLVGRLHRGARRFGAFLSVQMRHSLFVRAGKAVASRFGGVFSQSLVGRGLKAFGFRRMLITAFVLYLPLDVILREYIGFDLLSSLWDEAFLCLCVAYCIWRRLFRRVPRRTCTTPLDSPVLLYLSLGVCLLFVVSPDFSIALAGWRAVFQYMLWFFVLTRLFESDADLDCFFGAAAVMITVLALHGIYQYVIGVEMPVGWTTSTEVGVRTRVFSITTSCNIFGCLLVMFAPLVASFAYTCKRLWQKTLAWAAVGAVCLALLFTFCRGAWLAMVAAVVLFALLSDRRILAALGACVPVVTMIPSVANRIVYLFTPEFAHASAVGGRSLRWEFGMQLFRENLLTGFGLGRFGGAVAMQNQTQEELTYFYLDNYYLKVMAEEGLFGILVFAGLLVAILLFGLRGHRRLGHPRSAPAVRSAALLSGMVGVMVHMYTENILEVPYMNAYFWGFAAVLGWLCFVRGKAPLPVGKNKGK